MTHCKLLVMEMNEIPLAVLQAYVQARPKAHLAAWLASQRLCETLAQDLPEAELYPSQAWASLNSGLPFQAHRVKWFNDPKNHDMFYWAQAAKAGRSTVLVSTPHSSPLNAYQAHGNYKLVIPDFFATDAVTLPAKYSALQQLNLALTFANRRTTTLPRTVFSAIKKAIRHPYPSDWGMGRYSLWDLLQLAPQVLKNPERLRQGQFPLFMQIFLGALRTHQPDLGIVFSNHIASAMHRYLHAMPHLAESSTVYHQQWLRQYQNEVFAAIDLLDRWLGLIQTFATQHDYALVLVSALGQKLNANLNQSFVGEYQYDYRLEEPERLFVALGVSMDSLSMVGAMLPQYAFQAENADLAQALSAQLKRYASDPNVVRYGHYTVPDEVSKTQTALKGILYHVDCKDNIITLTLMLRPDETGKVQIGADSYHYSALGFQQFAVKDHHSGEHAKEGVLLYNARFEQALGHALPTSMDYLEVAGYFKRVLALAS